MRLFKLISKSFPLLQQFRYQQCLPCPQPRHLICFKQWTANMVLEVISSAINLKCKHRNTHYTRLNTLADTKVTILQEVNEPILHMAVSKASTLLGAYDVNIVDNFVWEEDYYGSVFSFMTDIIFVSTSKHMCVQRFADRSFVPVLCMKSRTHATIQALATVMAIIEEYGKMNCVNVSYLGPPHPVLNSYLLLCPMLGANIKYKCCCQECPVSPLLKKASEDLSVKTSTQLVECKSKEEVLNGACVVIAGPTSTKKEKIKEFQVSMCDIMKSACCNWIFFHTCPRGAEVDDQLFFGCQSRTFNAFENMQYIAAALMANAVKGFRF
ncbi:hypothetical protein K1T71_013491 [Dendrolimus kikuchii]|uniref:Uncharacterized protein n=1 Tax=Dendrolimus kikuchii TaxID=765133 RepID=A0ACC1CGM0_9NEOP|nr:hypothetical protein K1T71_013491 [Dendrolimus kikuchii]